MAERSAAVATRVQASSPMTAIRMGLCPTRAAMFAPVPTRSTACR